MRRSRPGRSHQRRRLAILFLAGVALAALVLAVPWRARDDADVAAPEPTDAPGAAPALAARGTSPRPPSDARRDGPEILTPTTPVPWDPAPRAARVVVLEPDGSPGRNRVLLADVGWAHAEDAPREDFSSLDVAARRTDALGHARFEPAPSRGLRVRVGGHDDVVGDPIALAPGEVAVLRLRPRPWVTVTVTDAEGRPLAASWAFTEFPWDAPPDLELARGLSVAPDDLKTFGWLFVDDGWPARATPYHSGPADAAGRARVSPALHGRTCRLTVAPPRGRRDLVATVRPRWTPRDETVVLYARRRLAGRVVDASGASVTDGVVRVEDLTGQVRAARVEYDATFALEEVPEGPVTVRWHGGEDAAGAAGPVRSALAGEEGVVVTADLGEALSVRVEGWPRIAGGEVVATREGGGPLERARADLDPDGRGRLVGLARDGVYTLFVGPTPAQVVEAGPWRFARREHVRPGADEVVLTLEEGTSIRGRVEVPGWSLGQELGAGWAWVDEGGVVVRAGIANGPGFALHGLPPGTYTVHAVRTPMLAWTAIPPDGFDVGETTARTGATDATVVLRHERQWKVPPALPRQRPSGDFGVR